MRLTTRLILSTAVLAAAVPCASPPFAHGAPPSLGVSTKATVIRVLDGDTIEVEIRRVVRVRLLDCWAPELKRGSEPQRQRGRLAKQFCERTALGTQGVLFVPTTNELSEAWSMGRVLGYYWPDDSEKSLSEIMVESSYATKEKP